MIETKISCDHCRGSIASFPKATLALGLAQLHLCEACTPALVDFFPGAAREIFEPLMTYAHQVDMTTETRILPTQAAEFSSYPNAVFDPRCFVIEERAQDWLVNDILIGNRSQFNQSGDVPGDMFAIGSALQEVAFDRCSMDDRLIVRATYIGKNPEGACFKAHFAGNAIGYPPSKAAGGGKVPQ